MPEKRRPGRPKRTWPPVGYIPTNVNHNAKPRKEELPGTDWIKRSLGSRILYVSLSTKRALLCQGKVTQKHATIQLNGQPLDVFDYEEAPRDAVRVYFPNF